MHIGRAVQGPVVTLEDHHKPALNHRYRELILRRYQHAMIGKLAFSSLLTVLSLCKAGRIVTPQAPPCFS